MEKEQLCTEMNSTLVITFHDETQVRIEFDESDSTPEYWTRTEYGLRVKWAQLGRWKIYPWESIKSYENHPAENTEHQHG